MHSVSACLGGVEILHFYRFPKSAQAVGCLSWISIQKSGFSGPLPSSPALCSAPVACVVRIAGILINRSSPRPGSLVTRANTHSVRVMGRLLSQDCQSPNTMFSFTPLCPLPLLPQNPDSSWSGFIKTKPAVR